MLRAVQKHTYTRTHAEHTCARIDVRWLSELCFHHWTLHRRRRGSWRRQSTMPWLHIRAWCHLRERRIVIVGLATCRELHAIACPRPWLTQMWSWMPLQSHQKRVCTRLKVAVLLWMTSLCNGSSCCTMAYGGTAFCDENCAHED